MDPVIAHIREDLKASAIDAWRRVCLVPELLMSVCADTAVRGNQT